MIYVMQRNDIVVVELDDDWHFAKVVEHYQDAQDNWDVTKVHVIGEPFTRDDNAFGGCYRITNIELQAAAVKLAIGQWGTKKAYATLEEIKAAILAA